MIEKLITNKKAQIDEATCIGCTLCIQACPVDAITGAAKQMHTVIGSECIGCNLCTEPCPVDCITLVTGESRQSEMITHANMRHENRQLRLTRSTEKQQKLIDTRYQKTISDRKILILEAVTRSKMKKIHDSKNH